MEWLKLAFVIGIGVFVLLYILVLWSCCVMSGRSNKRDEELELQHKTSDLSDLEKETVNIIVSNLTNKKPFTQ